jgi:16S rRNA (cytidine1402-2'-O)-methyltransferase
MSGTLHVVSTPIGHLGDLGQRARDVLAAAAAIVCEDTRVTRKLLDAYGIERPTVSFHAHSAATDAERLVARLAAGEDLALVSDAGTPLLSDPGERLVDLALDRGLRVSPVPGASALLAALVGSGLRTQPFAFLGFLPRSPGAQREVVAPLAALDLTLVIYEAPTRVARTLRTLVTACGPERRACVARELTKRFETFERGTLGALAGRFEAGTRGEVVILVGPPAAGAGEAPATDDDLRAEAQRLLDAGASPSDAAKTLAGALGVPKKRAYRMLLDLQAEDSREA